MLLKKLKLSSFLIFFLINQLLSGQNMNTIAEFGKYAPSSHNAQAWKVNILSNSIQISLDSTRILGKIDSINREAWISIGAFSENCILAGHDLGYDHQIQIFDCGPTITFFKKNISKTNYINFILNRRTVRKPFSREKIFLSQQKIIKNLDQSIKYYSLSEKKGNIISNYIYIANKSQLNNQDKLHELSKWIIVSKKENKERMDGLSPSMLGLNVIEKFFYYIIFNKKRIQTKFFTKATLNNIKKQINNCSGYIIITSTNNDIENWINSGRLLERLWLKLVEMGIYAHPMSQPLEESTYQYLKSELNINSEIQMILRVGYYKYKKLVKSNRRTIF